MSSPSPTQLMNTLEYLKAKFPDRFTGLGKFATSQLHTLHDDSTPIRHPPHQARTQLRDKNQRWTRTHGVPWGYMPCH